MSDEKQSDELRDFSQFNLHRGGHKAKLGLAFVAIDAWALFPLIILWFDRSVLSVAAAVSLIAILLFLEVYYRISPRLAFTKLIAFASGKKRYVRKYQKRRGRFTSGY